jgi:hypothetical protein
MNATRPVMHFLSGDVLIYPAQLPFAKADKPEPSLPLERFHSMLLVEIMCRAALSLTNEFADTNGRLDIYREMNVSRRPSNCVKIDALGVAAAILDELVNNWFDLRSD